MGEANEQTKTDHHRAPRSFLQRCKLLLQMLQVRLRFFIVIALGFLIVGQWERLRTSFEKLTNLGSMDEGKQAVSIDTEFFCPMDPGVLSNWPSKCPICNMALVRRKRGEAAPLPEGVVSRMQLSPYRMQLGGIRTSIVEYKPLFLDIVTVGTVRSLTAASEGAAPQKRSAIIDASVFDKDYAKLRSGQFVELTAAHLPGKQFQGRVQTLIESSQSEHPIVIVAENTGDFLRPGQSVHLRVLVSASELEPFAGMSTAPPRKATDTREVFICHDHPDTLHFAAGKCPIDKNELHARALTENQRIQWWCPMHPSVVADKPGQKCKECSGMVLVPRVQSFNPKGMVLAVPETAIVDSGSRKVVFVERMAGMFEGVEIVTGGRCRDEFPIVRGLEPGQRIAVNGAFLLDAETRLNPSIAAAYFGASRGGSAEPVQKPATKSAEPSPDTKAESTSEDEQSIRTEIAKLPAEDQPLARQQKICPVTQAPLGSMGMPVKISVAGRTVFLCCQGCDDSIRKEPAKYLARIPGAKK